MTMRMIIFCYFVFIVGTILALSVSGSWLGATEVDTVKFLTGYSTIEMSAGGMFSIPKAFGGLFTEGIPNMITWNYPYLESGFGAVFKWVFLYPISIGVVWGLVELFIPVLHGLMNIVSGFIPF